MFLKYCSAFKFRVRQFKKNSCLRRKSGWLMWVVNGQRALQANRCGSRGGGGLVFSLGGRSEGCVVKRNQNNKVRCKR